MKTGESPIQVMKVDSITAEKNTIPVLVLTQMNRLMELMTFDYSRKPRWTEKVTLLQGLYSGCRVMLRPVLNPLKPPLKPDSIGFIVRESRLARFASSNGDSTPRSSAESW